jgi:hypothetical protein
VLRLIVSYGNGIVECLSGKKPISITYGGSSRLRNAYPSRIRVIEARKCKGVDIRVGVCRFVSVRVYRYVGVRDRECR